MKTVAILQSNYIPWKGYFDMIANVDEFVLYDDMQYTKRDWRNRNKIKTPNGLQWLSIPVNVKGKFDQKINETVVTNHDWVEDHLKAFRFNYAKAAHFTETMAWIEPLYKAAAELDLISDINALFIRAICDQLEITTLITDSRAYPIVGSKSEALLSVLAGVGDVTTYVSGPAAKEYLDEAAFSQANITVEWMDYSGYSEYRQLFPPFEHGVSIVDLFFNEGEQAKQFLKYTK